MSQFHSIPKAFSRLKPVGLLLLALLFLNRALLISPIEMANGNNEINSIAEFLTEIITGQSNNIDEDGDTQETHNSAKTITPVFTQQIAQLSDIFDLSAKNAEYFTFPTKETIPQKPLLGTIDYPPQVS